jgi:hypothetical protein
MYLAPFNYDRFFERVFRHIHIAKAFLEDILDEKIEEIEPLPRKNKLTDDAAFVEFDFRCKIKGKYIIVDMQQWYKNDVVKRFYLYFCNNTSLQLESLKQSNIAIGEGKEYRTKKYDDVEPAITLIWMADDTLGFEDDIVAFTMLPEIFLSFIKDEALWENLNIADLKAYREKVLSILKNDTKNLSFLSENRMIYALQPNIVNNHKQGISIKLDKYIPWFQFAHKTKNDNNKAEDFESFKNKPIIMEVIELLKTSELSDDDIQYITDYEAHKIGAENYRQSLIEEERYDKKRLLKLKDEEMRLALKRKDEEMKLKDEEMKLKDEEFLNKQLHQIEKCLKRGDSLDIIADFMEIEIETLQSYIDMISKK